MGQIERNKEMKEKGQTWKKKTKKRIMRKKNEEAEKDTNERKNKLIQKHSKTPNK